MENFQELEIKLLDVDVDEIKRKLDEVGASYKSEVVQKIYTYDCYPVVLMYKLALTDYEITNSKNSLKKISNIYSYIEPVVNVDEQEKLREITGYNSIVNYIENCLDGINIEILKNEYILELLELVEKRFFKWIRLRDNGKKIELTIKYIYSVEAEYDIDQVKEIEILVDNFEVANKLVEEMGYYRKKLVEKKRTSYQYNNLSIEIDQWPLINPYVEIEGKNVDDIYDALNKLGYTRDDAKVMNTEDVYLKEGIDLNSFEVLSFNEQIKI